jgi:hypothetical protein
MPTVDFTLNDFKQILDQRFAAEREFTRQLVQTEVGELRAQFQSFVEHNFDPAMERIDRRFDALEHRVDRLENRVDLLAVDVAELRVDMRHVKQALRTHGLGAST